MGSTSIGSIGSGRSRMISAGTGGNGGSANTGRPPSGRSTPTSNGSSAGSGTAIPYGHGDHLPAPHRSESEATFKASGSRGICTNQDQTQVDFAANAASGRSNVGISVSSGGRSGHSNAPRERGASSLMAGRKSQRRGSGTSISISGRGSRKEAINSRQPQYPQQHTRTTDAGFSHPSWRQLQAEKKRSILVYSCIGVCVLAILLCVKTLIWPSTPSSRTGLHPASSDGDGSPDKSGISDNPQSDVFGERRKSNPNKWSISRLQRFDPRGRFVLEDYDAKPTFSNFLPAVAGIWGKPVWAFFVNRGQCISSFGTRSKAYPIMEFNSANKAYQSTSMLGFRTFLRISRNGHSVDLEPFSPTNTRWNWATVERSDFAPLPKRYMYVGSNEVQIRETDLTNMIETNVTYFTLPEEDFSSFVRRTTITNLNLNAPITMSMLDGLARIEPAGGDIDGMLKTMGRTLEAFFGVDQASGRDDIFTMPFYRMTTEAADSAAIVVNQKGHYVLSFVEGDDANRQLLPIVYDTSAVFGEDAMLLHPVGLRTKSVREILDGTQYSHAKTSSAFAAVDEILIPPGGSITVASFYGKANDITDVPVVARRVTAPGFVQYKFQRAIELVNQITMSAETQTNDGAFDGHVQQMFLDNSLRGGLPIILGAQDDNARILNSDEDSRLKVYHLFSRVHGDLERDYNSFIVEPTFFSEGPANFRDVAQNRRNDVFFLPAIGSFHIKMFLSFIQADGYQPNSVEAIVFVISDKASCDKLATTAVGHADGVRAQRELLSNILCNGPFRPGQLFLLMEDLHIQLIMDRQGFMDAVASVATTTPWAVFTQGYWADHFTYYLDLIKGYLAIYPEHEQSVMFEHSLNYFFSPAHVRPRSKKYVLSESYKGQGNHVRQLDATALDAEKQKERQKYFNEITGWYGPEANWQHEATTGKPFQSSPIEKLFLLTTLKFASRDPYGMGVEYEAGKPGWNDAMNGLPGMVGSGMPEASELIALLQYVRSVLTKYRRSVSIPIELATLIDAISEALDDLAESGYVDEDLSELSTFVPVELFAYWDSVSSAREAYRERVKVRFKGEKVELSPSEAVEHLDRWIQEVGKGRDRAFKIGTHGGDSGDSGIVPTYFSFNVTKWKSTGEKNKDHHDLVMPISMKVQRFPLYLEGPTRMLKTIHDEEEALNVHKRVRKSPLRDERLGMFTISASLKGSSFDMGRVMAFTPGWLENESVWTHMSYKYYLELLRHGLYDQFFEEMKTGMLPYMDSDSYGRSVMECSSFIASSAFEDPSQRGRGFLARLSGSTAEFLSMWVLMMIGSQPFVLDKHSNKLAGMQLIPVLPAHLFRHDSGASNGKEKTNKSGDMTISFKLFTAINVTYHNSDGRDLFGVPPKRYEVGLRDGSKILVENSIIPADLAEKIRRVAFVDCIDAYF